MAQIDKPNLHFNTITYTGDDVDGRTITGVGFQSDWTWVKARNNAFSPYIIDSIRYDSGASKYLKLDSSYNGADETPSGAGWISQLNSDGYVCKNGTSNTNNCNENSVTYVAWNWLGGNGTSSNTDGSITSTVSANTTAGFSVVTYTGNSTGSNSDTVGHGLGSAPSVIIVKSRSAADNWAMYHTSNGTGKHQVLNATNTTSTDANIYPTTPTNSVFYPGSQGTTNNLSRTYVAYCFAEKKGFSKFGSYTGNGNADGTFVYTGFVPSFVMIKRTDAVTDWMMFDNKRTDGNPNLVNKYLLANDSGTEGSNSTTGVDFLSNGFKSRNTFASVNASGGSYIYMAFAENPIVGSNDIPATAE